VTPGRRPPGETRPGPRPWQQRTGKGPAVREARPPSPTRPPAPLPGQAKPEVRPAGTAPKVVAAPATAPSQAPDVRESTPPAQGPVSPAPSTTRAAQNEAASPPASSQPKPGGPSRT
jgi:hypothetical protein